MPSFYHLSPPLHKPSLEPALGEGNAAQVVGHNLQAEPAFHAIGPVVAASVPAKATLVLFSTKCTESMGLSSWFTVYLINS